MHSENSSKQNKSATAENITTKNEPPCAEQGGFVFLVSYTIKCNILIKEKVHINPWYNVIATKQKTKEDSYELYTSYHRRALLSTGILQ